eukprot:6207170-Pleurochrysis_carterae.AAC.1
MAPARMSHVVELAPLPHEPLRVYALFILHGSHSSAVHTVTQELRNSQAQPPTFWTFLECGMVGATDEAERLQIIFAVRVSGKREKRTIARSAPGCVRSFTSRFEGPVVADAPHL